MRRTRRATSVDNIVGRNIRIARLQHGFSQTELGQRIGVTFQQVQKYENGSNRASASRLTQIAEALGIPVVALFEGSPSAKRPDPLDSALTLLAQPHSLRLVQAFDKISEDRARIAVLQLVEAMGRRGPRNVGSQRRNRG